MRFPTVKIGDVVQLNPRLPASIKLVPPQTVTFLGMASVSENGLINKVESCAFDEVKKGFTYFEEGDVLLAKITPCFENGKATLAKNLPHRVGFGSTEFHVFRPSSKIDARYLFFLLWNKTFRETGRSHMAGAAGQKRLQTDYLANFKIPLPPLDEQRRIAAVLDKADALRRQRQESLQLTENLLQSVFLDMFGEPVTNPKNFPVRKLGDFFSSPKEGAKCGPFGSALKKSDSQQFGVPVWGIDNISTDGHFVDRAFTRISKEKFDELKSYKAANGDILISRAGTVGKMCVTNSTEGTGIIGSNLIRLRLNAALLSPHWFVSFMKYSKERVARLRAGADGAFTHMSTKILQGLEFPYPSPELQNDFLESCQAVERINHLGTGSSNYLDQLFSSLQQRAFRGELDLNRLILDSSENSPPTTSPEKQAKTWLEPAGRHRNNDR